MRSFGSDNNSGVHPKVMKALEEANRDHAIAYGDDPWTAAARLKIKEAFGEEAEPFFVFNGTGANVIALRACTSNFNSIISATTAHIAVDECGAPVFMTGAALKEIATPDGKLTPELIHPQLYNWGFEHHSQPKVVYISQCTELGTVYQPGEIRQIADYIHQYGMYLHLDGARLANAAAALGLSLRQLTTDCGVDIVSFGGTKNGLMMAESVITLRPELAENLKYLRKQSAQLYSKMRYVSAQFSAYLEDDLWLQNATHANAMARQLRQGIESLGRYEFTQSTDANILLVKIPKETYLRLQQKYFFYVWNEFNDEVRFVTSWDTTEEDVEGLVREMRDEN
jgi:threonine aldolase